MNQQQSAVQPTALQSDEAAVELRQTLADLLAESHSVRRLPAITLDSHLERDLELDSLARAELLARLERLWQRRLPETLLNAETAGDLLNAVLQAEPLAARPHVPAAVPVIREAGQVAVQAETLNHMLALHAQQQPRRMAICLYEADAQQVNISYHDLWQQAQGLAAGLRERGLTPGQTVALMLPTGQDYFTSFFGVLLAGGVPVPIYPPLRPSQLEEHLRRHARLLSNAQVQILITVDEARRLAQVLASQVPSLHAVVTTADVLIPAVHPLLPTVSPEALAFVQYSSGSTGDPKGVMLTHANLLANIRAMCERLQADSDDVFVSWLPLYHDMGLIGACLSSLYQASPLVVMSPLSFLRRPVDWLWAIHQHRGTLSAAPNFAYELCLRHVVDADIEGLDLSSLRYLANGAEPVSADTLRRFAERFAPYGLNPGALAPVYGLAECSVGLALPQPGRGLQVDRIKPAPLRQQGVAVPAEADDNEVLEHVACGYALRDHEMRIVDDMGRELPDRREGRIQFRGPSATQGYLHNPQATAKLIQGDWLDSGDRGYLVGGEIHITGRDKDVIIRSGRNYYPYDLEHAVGQLEEVRRGCVAVFAAACPHDGTEKLVVVAETRSKDETILERLRGEIAAQALEQLGTPVDDIVLAPPQTVLKTSSGKIRRNAMRDYYQQGTLLQRGLPIWWQLTRVAASSVRPAIRRRVQALRDVAFGVGTWLVAGLLTPVLWAGIMFLPGERRRWQAVRGLLRSAGWVTGYRPQVQGLEHLPSGACVLAVNHASYLDALVLASALPRPFQFVAKRELTTNPWLHRPLQRLGVVFVERFDRQQGVAETDRLTELAAGGAALVFYPEGTFTRAPGLLPFRMGAFVTAARASLAVVPVTLTGTRAALRAGTWLPRPAQLGVQISPPIQPQGTDWPAIRRLAQATREVMVLHCGEPDLDPNGSPRDGARP
jgi:1-acyl-sn-glycerol-3-phosphate acyltransferase